MRKKRDEFSSNRFDYNPQSFAFSSKQQHDGTERERETESERDIHTELVAQRSQIA